MKIGIALIVLFIFALLLFSNKPDTRSLKEHVEAACSSAAIPAECEMREVTRIADTREKTKEAMQDHIAGN